MAIDAETERLMQNWARWKSGAGVAMAVSSAYNLEATGAWGETPMPLIDGDAIMVDAAVESLPDGLKVVLIEYWVRGGLIDQKVRRCRCTRRTFYRRLDDANRKVVQLVQERRRSYGRARVARGEPAPQPKAR